MNTTQTHMAEAIEAAKAALRGEVPADIPSPCAEAIAAFADLADKPAPVLTLEELEQILPLEQAFHEVLDETEGSSYRVTPFDNPIYRHELGQARRRTLQRLLELAEASPAPRVEVTTLAGAIAELEKKARDFNKLSRAETTARLEEGMALCAEIKACCRDAITTGDFRLCQAAFAALSMFVNGPPSWERGYPAEVTRD